MATNPYAKYLTGPSGGDPIVKPVDPYKARDQQLQEEAAARAAAAADRAAAADERSAAAAERAATKDAQGTVDEKKIATLLTRIAGGFNDINNVTATDRSAQEPGLIESVRGDLTPGGITGPAVRSIAGPERRTVHDSQRDVLDALLTLGTGAAYNAEQLSGQMSSYFPQYGDTPQEIAVKNQRMQRIIEAAKANAGPAWAQVEPAIAPYMQRSAPADGAALGASMGAAMGGQVPRDPNAEYDAQGNIVGLTGSVTDDRPGPGGAGSPPRSSGGGTDYSWNGIGKALEAGVGDVIEGGFNNTAGIVVNPIGRTLYEATGYGGQEYNGGKILRDTFGLPEGDPTASAIIQAGTGALGMAGMARGLAGIATGSGRNALAQFGATPIRDMAAGAGAGAGGEVGRNYGGVPGQIAGTLIGGVGGYGGANALARTVAGTRQPNALLSAADDLGVEMMPADVGGVGTRMATGATGSTLGAIPMAEGAARSVASAARARTNIANDIGDITDNVGAGQATKRGFDSFTRSSKDRGDALYERVSVPAENKVQLGQTREALAEVTRGMQSNPELSRLWANHPRMRQTLEALTPNDVAVDGRLAFTEASDRLTALQDQFEVARNAVPTDPQALPRLRAQIDAARQDLTKAKELVDTPPQGGELSWQDMKRFRSIVGEIVGQPGIQRDGSDIAALRKLYAALTSDMEVTAAQAGPKALQEFRRANQYWRGRESRIDDVFASLLGKDGKRSDEAVFKQINSWAKGEGGDFSRIARTIRSMPEDEANTIRSTIIQRMGLAKPANQDAAGEVFSPALFSTEWRGMSNRAKNVLFPNKQHRDDLEKLALVTDGMKRADQYQNMSRTAVGVNAVGQGALAFAHPFAAAAMAGMQFGAGRLLASPRFARILASSAKLPPEQAGRRISEQLSVLATREPLIANDIKSVQQFLADQMGKSPGRAAAEDSADSRRPPPQ